MKARMIFRGLKVAVAVASSALVCASATFAQGCALCYSDAAATGPKGQAALRHGIITLIIPPTLIFVGMLSTLYRRRNLYRESIERASLHKDATVSEIVLHLR
ncbi:MAG TPA: hypothetical protein VGU63_13670 [Candidatus Acidoferrales bacterium]|nr:hypothetical protein [Candidatus Acidoferrales bacterium]